MPKVVIHYLFGGMTVQWKENGGCLYRMGHHFNRSKLHHISQWDYCINILTASTKRDYILGELINMSNLISERWRQEGADLSAEGRSCYESDWFLITNKKMLAVTSILSNKTHQEMNSQKSQYIWLFEDWTLANFLKFTNYRKSHIKNSSKTKQSHFYYFQISQVVKVIGESLNIFRSQNWSSCFCSGFPRATL